MHIRRPSARRRAFAAAVLLLETAAVAQAGDRITAIAVPALEAKMQQDGIPGLSCAIAVGDDVSWSTGLGFADVENDVPATERTVYRLASISKPITAVLAMQLVEQGRLDLDADVHTLVAQWPEKRWPVTTRQLLGHLGGVRHYKPREGECTEHYPDQTAALVRFADDRLLHEPGTRYRYSTFGFNLAAAVVEARSGRRFVDVLRDRIAGPCGAPTLQDDDPRRLIKGRAQGYVRRNERLQNSRLMDASYKLGGGGLCSSAPDLVRFARALMTGELLSPESLAVVWRSQATRDGKATDYGLGFAVREHDGVQVVQHAGAQSRVSTMLLLLPERRVAVAILCNLEGVKLGAVARELAFAVSAEELR